MIPRIFHSALFIVLLAACGGNKEKQPEYPPGVLKPDEMVDVIADFALAESAVNLNILGVVPQKADSAYAFNPLAERNISKARYDSSVKFYIDHPKEYKEIYERVLERLTELQTKTDTAVKK